MLKISLYSQLHALMDITIIKDNNVVFQLEIILDAIINVLQNLIKI